MAEERIFVGRTKEIEQFKKVLEDRQGQAVLVVGQAGMGKTLLLNKMTKIAGSHPNLRCGFVRYAVTPTDSVDSTMSLIMDNAFETAQAKEKSFDGTTQRLEQWRSFLNVFNIGDLVMSLRRDPARNTRDQFLERLELISKRLPNEGRAIFIIDPEKYMQKESEQSWAIVIKSLPEKIKFIFAQRPEGELVLSETFDSLKNVLRIPKKDLDVLSDDNVDELLRAQSAELTCSMGDLKKVLIQYKGHPYALGAAIDLVKAGVGLEDLPKRPEPIEFAKKQWEKICEKGKDAIRLFKAYSVLEVGVPDDLVETVGEVDGDTRQSLLADKFLMGLLREEGYGNRIYHAILADYVFEQISEAEKKEYHARAVEVYRDKLKRAKETNTKPDELAAMRLPEHVKEAEGPKAFVYTFINECTPPLINLGLLDAAISFSQQALEWVEEGSEEKAALIGNLGLIYRKRGEPDKAEQMHKKALAINEKFGRIEEMAIDYGNLGVIYGIRGELDKAEEMFNKALQINKKHVHLEGMADQYSELGLVAWMKGNLDEAEQLHLKGLKIEQKLGRIEGIARQYGNLGLIYQTKGKLDKAEEMFKKSLEIAEKLGLKEIMAIQYGNWGLIYQTRGQLDKAGEVHEKALDIAERLGLKEAIAEQYAALGLVNYEKGNLTEAERMHLKGLEIEEKIGRLEGVARQYGNLGVIYQDRGQLDKAEEMYNKALQIHKKLGLQEGVANDYGNLGEIYEKRGDIAKAKELWEKARDLYNKIGMPHRVKMIEEWIEGLDKTEGGSLP